MQKIKMIHICASLRFVAFRCANFLISLTYCSAFFNISGPRKGAKRAVFRFNDWFFTGLWAKNDLPATKCCGRWWVKMLVSGGTAGSQRSTECRNV
jgi:hypothetical protein